MAAAKRVPSRRGAPVWFHSRDRLIDTLPGAPHEALSLTVGMKRC